MRQGARLVCDPGHKSSALGGGAADGLRAVEIRGADEEDVALFFALKRFHCVYVMDHSITLRTDMEVFEQGFGDESAANGAAYGLADHGSNSGVIADSTPVPQPIQYLQVIALCYRP
jgi:hypothetical protein